MAGERPGGAQLAADLLGVALAQQIADVALLVPLTALHERVGAEDLADRLAQRLAAVDDEQNRLLGIKATRDQVREQVRGQPGVLRAAFPQAERDLDAVGGDPSATMWVRSATSIPSSIITASRRSSSERLISSSSAVVVRSTTSSEIDVLLVAVADCSTSRPTGSPTLAYLRVDTPASIRFMTASVSGSRSAKNS